MRQKTGPQKPAGLLPLPPKQNEQPSVSETSALIGQFAQPQSQFDLRRSAGPIADHLAVGGNDLAGPPFRKPHIGLQMRDRVSLGGMPYHYYLREARGVLLRPAFARPAASSFVRPLMGRTLINFGGNSQ